MLYTERSLTIEKAIRRLVLTLGLGVILIALINMLWTQAPQSKKSEAQIEFREAYGKKGFISTSDSSGSLGE